MTFDEFCEKAGKIFDSLPPEFSDNFSMNGEEEPTEAARISMSEAGYNNLYGYWNKITPTNITLCYWGFKAANDFSDQRISSVIKHEIEHAIMNPLGLKHSEHK